MAVIPLRFLSPVMLDADLDLGAALARLDPFRGQDLPVVIRRQLDMFLHWYVRPLDMVLEMLERAAPGEPLDIALDLHEHLTDPTCQVADLEGFEPEEPTVILDGRRVEWVLMPPMATRNGGGGRRGAPAPRPDGWAGAEPPGAGPEDPEPDAEPEEGGGGAGPAPAWQDFAAYPYIGADDVVTLGEDVRVEIGLAAEAVPGVQGGSMVFRIPAGAAEFELELLVSAPGFSIKEGEVHQLPVSTANPAAHRVSLTLVAPPGRLTFYSEIQVYYMYRGQPCGRASRRIIAQRPEVGMYDQPLSPRATPWAGAGDGLVAMPPLDAPVDMTLIIDRSDVPGDETPFTCRLSTRHAPHVAVPQVRLPVALPNDQEPAVFAAELAEAITAVRKNPLVVGRLQSVGEDVARLLPDMIWAAIRDVWQHVRQSENRTPTLLIYTMEYHVPWELAYLEDLPGGVELPLDPGRPAYLGAQLAAGRWSPGRGKDQAMRSQHPVAAMAVMATTDTLDHAAEELRHLTEVHRALAIKALSRDLAQVLHKPEALQALHFACHGRADALKPGYTQLVLDEEPHLTPRDLHCKLCKEHHPFIFFNACQVGNALTLIRNNMGFAGQVLRSGACGCLAPLWDISDQVAVEVAKTFYAEAFAGRAAGEVMRDLRSRFQNEPPEAPDPTWLAYVYYGHPGLRFVRQ